MAKFIFVTGGVVSSLGKGIAAASIGCLLESRGLTVSLQKFDPYLNVDPGTMSPFQHGEVFVTDDGAETDLDLGHYERFTHSPLTRANNLTSGRIYEQIISRERRGDYLGKTVQVIPHVTNEIKAAVRRVSSAEQASAADVVICEIAAYRPHLVRAFPECPEIDRQRLSTVETAERRDAIPDAGKQHPERQLIA